ncbi:MAG: PKD domain-containing protein, partial [Solirubrobacterales bacterium]
MTRPSPKRSRLWLIALAALMLMAGAGTGSAVAGDGTGAPSITSDRADYAPGEHVVLTGANWQPGESVDIVVNDDQGETWRHEATVTADGQGEIRDEFDLPQWLVATYSVTAIGEASGTANASFTDGNTFVKNASTTAAGVTVSYRLEKWSNATNCPSSPSPNTTSNFTITGPNAATVSGTSSVASNAGDSVRISMLSATGGNGFDKWQLASGSPTASDGSAFAGGSAVCFNAPSNSSATQTFVGFVKQTAQPPTASAGSDQTVNEGSTVHLDGSGSAGATSYSWTQLSGPTVTLSGATTASPSFTAPNGPATMTFRLSATNAAGSNTDDIQITVNNVPPSVALSGPTSANKHDTKTYTYTISDPGDSRGNISVTESCGANGTRIDTPAPDSFDCSFDHVGSSTVRVTANDGSDTGSDSKTVTIGAVAPTVSMSGATSANEGNTKTYTYTVSDPDATVTESCGANGTRIDTAASNSFDCTFPDGPSTSQVRVSATADGATGFGEKSVAVADVAPQITLSGPDSANEGETKHYSYTVTDPGADT